MGLREGIHLWWHRAETTARWKKQLAAWGLEEPSMLNMCRQQHRNVCVDCNLGNKWKLDSVVTCCSPRLIASHSFFVNIPGRSLTWASPQPQKRCQIFRFSALQIEDEIDQTSENPWCAEEWLLWHAAVETVSWGCRVFTTQKCGLCSGMASTRWWIPGSACQQYFILFEKSKWFWPSKQKL